MGAGAAAIPASDGAADRAPRHDRLRLLIPAMLVAIGLAAALIAWRTSIAASAADAATEAGLTAARQRAASVIVGEGLTARSTEAYVDFERARRRANLLEGNAQAEAALLSRMEARGHWFLVRPEYLAPDGAYLPDRQRAALIAANEQRIDIKPDRHFVAADREYARIRSLLLAGIVISLAFPFLTVAEMVRGRLRGATVVAGSVVFGLGALLAAGAWL